MRTLIVCLLTALSADGAETALLAPDQAAAEIRAALAMIRDHHPDPYHRHPREAFVEYVERLGQRQSPVDIARHYFDLSGLLALVADTHTQLRTTELTPGFDETYPLRFHLFPEGLYIIAAGEPYRELLGARVLSIAGQPTDAVLDQIASTVPAEHALRRRVFAETYLYQPESFRAFGLTSGSAAPVLQVETLDGRRLDRSLDATWRRRPDEFGGDALNPFLPPELLTVHAVAGTEPPEYLRHLDQNYRFELRDEGALFYLQINLPFAAEGGESPMDFHLRWIQALRASEATTLVVDLRNNPGGSLSLMAPVPALLEIEFFAHPSLQGAAVLIGPDTVSAGSTLAAELESAIRPVFIGAPTGTPPNLFLDAVKVVMPHSRIEIEVSRHHHVVTRESDDRRFIAPDIEIANSFDDYLHGRDRVLEAAANVDRGMRGRVYAGASPYDPWNRASQARARAAH